MKLPELKRRFKNKYVIRIAADVLTIAVAGGSAGVYTVNAAKTSTKAETTQESTDKKDKKDNKDDEEDLKEVLSSKISKAADEEVGKEETVYVVADNSGKAKDVIVSDWLKNPDGNETIEDVSDLKDIKNVKGKEKFEEKDGKIIWKAKGKDIYYQGKTDKQRTLMDIVGDNNLSHCAYFGDDIIDINCGCPVNKVLKANAGSKLLQNPQLIYLHGNARGILYSP